jgi:hypothetical protein
MHPEGDHGLKNLNDGDFSCVFGQAQADERTKQRNQSRARKQKAVMVRGGFVQAKAEGDRFVEVLGETLERYKQNIKLINPGEVLGC